MSEALAEIMKKHGKTIYRDDDAAPPLVITLSSKDDVKVTRAEEENE